MPRTKPRPQPITPPAVNGPGGEVLTLSEAAAYLRLAEQEVVRLVHEQDLPAREAGTDWRFLKTAIQHWLSQPLARVKKEGIWAAAGSLKDDPYLEEMLQEIDHMRGRPTTEAG